MQSFILFGLDYQDMGRTSNSVLYTSKYIADPSGPKLGPFCAQLEERHVTSGAHVSGSTTLKYSESVNIPPPCRFNQQNII